MDATVATMVPVSSEIERNSYFVISNKHLETCDTWSTGFQNFVAESQIIATLSIIYVRISLNKHNILHISINSSTLIKSLSWNLTPGGFTSVSAQWFSFQSIRV